MIADSEPRAPQGRKAPVPPGSAQQCPISSSKRSGQHLAFGPTPSPARYVNLGKSFISPDLSIVCCLFRAAPKAYGSSQARSQIGATAAGLSHSHNNVGSKPGLRPASQLTASQILNPLSEARDQTRNLMDTSWIHFCYTTTGTALNILRGFFCLFVF